LLTEITGIYLAKLEFSKHFLHFSYFISQLLLLCFQSTNEFVCFTFIDNSFVLNFFSLISIS